MYLTKAQQEDIELCMYFMPSCLKEIKISENDKIQFLEWSERGKHKEKIKNSHFKDGFNALVSAKQWRGRTVHELWEPGILEGSMPYFVILGEIDEKEKIPSRCVVDFMKKEMFKGIDADLIENIYKKICNQ